MRPLSMNDVINHTLTFNHANVNRDPMGEIRAYRAPGYLSHILEIDFINVLHGTIDMTTHNAQCTMHKVISNVIDRLNFERTINALCTKVPCAKCIR